MTRLRIILQARTTSTRLPAKVLLPVAGLPLAVLCARRLARGGLDLVLATSDDPSDDGLAAIVGAAGIAVVRGPLDDVAQRFASATRDLGDEDLLVRATADNPVPDHDIVTAMLADFDASGTDYLGMRSYRDMPYGGAVEIARLGAFRAVTTPDADAATREHVTPTLAALVPTEVRNPRRFDLGLGPVRVTVDTLNDYLIAARAFVDTANGVDAEWQTLVRKIHALRTKGE